MESLEIHYALSLGEFCLTANALTSAALRAFASPLDWAFSSPTMIAHCVVDDWKSFLNPALYTEHAADALAHAPRRSVAGHRLYSPMVKKPKIFLHRSPLVPAEYAYYERCVARVRTIAADAAACTLLVLVQSSKHRSKHAAWAPQFAPLFDALDVHWRGRFELLVVRLQYNKGSAAAPAPAPSAAAAAGAACEVGVTRSTRGNSLRLVYLRCVAPHSGAAFGDPRDLEAFCDVVRADHRFALRPDPLPREHEQMTRGGADGVTATAVDAAAVEADMARRRGTSREAVVKRAAEKKARKAAGAAAYAAKLAAASAPKKKKKLSKAGRRAQQEAQREAKARCKR